MNVFPFTVFRQSDHSGEDRSGIDLQNRTGFPVTHLIKNKSSEHQLLIVGILADHYGLSTHIKKQEKPGLDFRQCPRFWGAGRESAVGRWSRRAKQREADHRSAKHTAMQRAHVA